jgi:AAA+ ATPase superfamily predicted ATPase
VIVPQREQCNEAIAATDTVGRFLRAFHGGTQPLSTFAARLDAIGGDTVKVGSTKHECVKSGVSLSAFIGRDQQLNVLDGPLLRVTEGGGKPGKALLMRGRRRVGKSRLVEEFLSRAGVPHVYFTASTRSTGEELRLFVEEVRGSSLPGADLFEGVTPTSWDGALRLLGAALPDNGLSVVVIDELPYLTRSDPAFEGTLQKVFDRELSRRRMLFIGVGSDLAMMEALNGHGRPFYQRATEMVVPPLSPAEVAAMLKLDPANAFDAYLVTGGLPLILDEWKAGASLWEYLEDAVASPTSALLVSAERALTAEFPAELQALEVLTAIGSGERTFTNIGRAAGIAQPSLARALGILKTKRVVAAGLLASRNRPWPAHLAS